MKMRLFNIFSVIFGLALAIVSKATVLNPSKLSFFDNFIFIRGKSLTYNHLWNNIFFWVIASLFFIYPLVRIYKDRKRKEEIEIMLKQLEKINIGNVGKKYADFSEKMSNHTKFKKIREIWNNYKETIIERESEGNIEYFQTVDAEYFFNNDTLLKEKMNSKLLDYLPQGFIGLGLLGTFFGLALGLENLDLSSQDTVQESIRSLIYGVKTSFYTSLYGIYFSIMFSFIMNVYIGEFEAKITKLKDKLNNIFHKSISDKEISEIKNELIQVKENIEIMSHSIASDLSEEIQVFSKEFIKNIDLFNSSMEKVMSESLDKIFTSNFVANLQNLKEEFFELYERNNIFISQYTSEIKEITQDVSSLRNSYSDISSNLKEDFAKIFGDIWTIYMEKFKTINDAMQRNAEEYNSYIKEGTQEYTLKIKEGTENLFKDYDLNLSNVVEKFNQVLLSFAKQIDESNDVILNNKELLRSMKESIDRSQLEE